MNRLPCEIETEIWKLYYMNIYTENCLHELENNFQLVNSFPDNIENIKKIVRIHRFMTDPTSLVKEKGFDFKKLCSYINKAIALSSKNKSYIKIVNNITLTFVVNNYDSFLNYDRICNKYSEFPQEYRYIAHCVSISCNYQKKLLKIFKKMLEN
jgi:hypothetical protein